MNTLYRKYRPQRVEELDLLSAKKELEAVLSSGKFSHAYLFSGPHGTGKTSAARILAKVVNCVRNTTRHPSPGNRHLNEPCNVCVSCREITQGISLDLLEIDAASNRGIDDIRELRERIKLAPAKSRYKVYIIDEVHMLTSEAFNALLKTLEEPPAHALFILCTTDPQRLPETVVSRCTQITFRKASREEVVASLQKAVSGEKLVVEEGVLAAIADLTDGSFRDGMKVLEQLSLRLSGGKQKRLTVSDVLEFAGLAAVAPARLVECLVKGSVEEGLALVDEVVSSHANVEFFIREVLSILRAQLLLAVGYGEGKAIPGLNLPRVRRAIQVFSEAAERLRTAVIPSLPLELAVVEWFVSGQSGTSEPPSAKDFKGEREKRSDLPGKNSGQKRPPSSRSTSDVGFADIEKGWAGILEVLRPRNHSLEALLKAAKPKELAGDVLVIEVLYPFHKEQLELRRYRSMVEEALSETFSQSLTLRFVLRPRQLTPDLTATHENVSGAVRDEDIVRAAEEIFGK